MPTKPRAPRRHRFALLIFLFVYPLVTAIMYFVMPMTPDWPIWLRTLVMVPIIVVSMVFAIIPFIQTRLKHLL